MKYKNLIIIIILITFVFIIIYTPVEPFRYIKKGDEYYINGKKHIFQLKGGHPILKSHVSGKMIKLLEKLTNVFDSNKIFYWLSIGTLLGAVRHQGLIPWDDDMDIVVPLEYVEKMKVAVKENNLNISNSGGGYKVYDKTSYPFVDIIIVNKIQEKWMLCYPLNKDKTCSYEKSKEWPKECFDDKEVFPLKKLPFENLSVSVPNNYEKLLKQMYGEGCLEKVYRKPFITLNNHKFNNLLYNIGLIDG